MAQIWFNKNDAAWQQNESPLSVSEIIKRYEMGMAATWYDPEAKAEARETFKATGGYADFTDASHAMGFADSYADKLVVPFVEAVMIFPGCFPGSAQARGDCVSHGRRTADFMTMAGDIGAGVPDEVTGKLEGVPSDLPLEGQRDVVLSSEWSWWWRGYSGDGWSSSSSTPVSIKHGSMLRKAYPDLGIDLTKYSYSNTAKYGRSSPPESMAVIGRVHAIRTAANCNTFDELRDALGNRHGITTDGGEGFSSTRDQYGMSSRRGSWSHCYPFLGADDRPKIKQKFGEPLVLNMNNWGTWNSGPRDIFESADQYKPELKQKLIELDLVNPETGNLMIPKGAWWTRWSDVKRREIYASAGYSGWTKKQLPNWGNTDLI